MRNEIQDNHPTNSKDNSDCLSKAKKLIYLRKMNKISFYFKKNVQMFAYVHFLL